MEKMFKVCLMGLILGLFMTGCGQSAEAEEQQVLVMGTSADYKPFQFFDLKNDNEIVGFDIDLANYIADSLGYTLEVVDMDFNTLITALRAGRVDMVLAGMSATPERREVVDFSDIYHQSRSVILTTTGFEVNSVEDLNGKTIGSQTGSLQEEIVVDLIENGIEVESRTMDRLPELVQQLIAGRIDAVVIESLNARIYLESNPDFITFDVLEQRSLGSAIALPKGSELTEQINEILAEMRENGEFERMEEKWFNE